MTNTTIIDEIKTTAMNDIIEILNNIDGDELIDIANNYTGYEFYTDLNDLFDGWNAREILETYIDNEFDIDACYYRNDYGEVTSYDCETDLFDFDDFARDCIENDNDYDNDDIREVLDNMNDEIREVNDVENAIKALHEKIDELLYCEDKLTVERVKGALIAITDENFTNY